MLDHYMIWLLLGLWIGSNVIPILIMAYQRYAENRAYKNRHKKRFKKEF